MAGVHGQGMAMAYSVSKVGNAQHKKMTLISYTNSLTKLSSDQTAHSDQGLLCSSIGFTVSIDFEIGKTY